MANKWGNSGNSGRLFSWAPKSGQMVTAAMKFKDTCFLEENYDQPRQHIKSQKHCFANKDMYSQIYGFSCSHVRMWELDHKKSWVPKNWCFWTVLLERTLKSPLDCKEIKWVNPKRNQSWIFIGLILKWKLQYSGHLMWGTDSLEKTLMLRKIAGRRRGNRWWDGWMASLTQWTWVWASSQSWWWIRKPHVLWSREDAESDTTEQLNWTKTNQ